MITLSCVAMSTTATEIVTNLVLTFVISVVGIIIYNAYTKLNTVHEYTISHTERHRAMDRDIERIDKDMKEARHELSSQMTALDEKLDDFMKEVREALAEKS